MCRLVPRQDEVIDAKTTFGDKSQEYEHLRRSRNGLGGGTCESWLSPLFSPNVGSEHCGIAVPKGVDSDD